MKTDKNSRTATTREGHLSQSELERAVPTTNTATKYEAILSFKQFSRAKIIIEAMSLAEAEEKANAIESDEIDDWNPCNGEVSLDSVEPVEGGQSHE